MLPTRSKRLRLKIHMHISATTTFGKAENAWTMGKALWMKIDD